MSIVRFDDPGCVFIRIHKTGSTSIINGLFGGIRKAAEIARNGEWSTSFDDKPCFTFVRNPFERLVSVTLMFRDYPVSDPADLKMREKLSVDEVMDVIEDDAILLDQRSYRSKLRLHALPLTHPSVHISRAKFVGRMENFAQDYRALADWLDLPAGGVPQERWRSEPLDYRSFYGSESRRRAERMLERDAAAFNYAF